MSHLQKPKRRTKGIERKKRAVALRRGALTRKAAIIGRREANFFRFALASPKCIHSIKTSILETLRTGQEAKFELSSDGYLTDVKRTGPEGNSMGHSSGEFNLKFVRAPIRGNFDFAFHTHPKTNTGDIEAHLLSAKDLESAKEISMLGLAVVPTYRTQSDFVEISFLFAKIPRRFNYFQYENILDSRTSGNESLETPKLQREILRKLGVKICEFHIPFLEELEDFGFIASLRERIVKELT